MAVPSDEDLLNMGTKYFFYKSSGNSGSITGEMDAVDIAELNKELSSLNDQIFTAQAEEETYNEIYLNNKRNPTTYGLFSNWGLRTTQDWVLAFTYFSYTIFSILYIFVTFRTIKEPIRGVPQEQENPLVNAAIALGITTSIGGLLTFAIFNYA